MQIYINYHQGKLGTVVTAKSLELEGDIHIICRGINIMAVLHSPVSPSCLTIFVDQKPEAIKLTPDGRLYIGTSVLMPNEIELKKVV